MYFRPQCPTPEFAWLPNASKDYPLELRLFPPSQYFKQNFFLIHGPAFWPKSGLLPISQSPSSNLKKQASGRENTVTSPENKEG